MIQILFLFLTSGFVWSSSECHKIGPKSEMCIYSDGSKTIAVEERPLQKKLPLRASYFDSSGKLQIWLDWPAKTFLRFDALGKIEESLIGPRYLLKKNGVDFVECEGLNCFSEHLPFQKIDPQLLQPGDLLFLGNLNLWSGSNQAVFTHVAIVKSFDQSGPIILSNEMLGALEEGTLTEETSHTVQYLILRHPKLIEALPELSRQHKTFMVCSQAIAKILDSILASRPEGFKRLYPEYQALNCLQSMQVIGFHLTDFKTIEAYKKERPTQLEPVLHTWQEIEKTPDRALYLMFTRRFPFQPLIFQPHLVEDLIDFVAQGYPEK